MASAPLHILWSTEFAPCIRTANRRLTRTMKTVKLQALELYCPALPFFPLPSSCGLLSLASLPVPSIAFIGGGTSTFCVSHIQRNRLFWAQT